MTARARVAVLLMGTGGVLALLLWAVAGLPDFGRYAGPYGDVVNSIGVARTHATNVVNSVVFDFRAIDTVGEEFILFAAVIGVTLLLRVEREETERPIKDEAADRSVRYTSDAFRIGSLLLIVPSVALGIYVVMHGHQTPGGGFQGGVILAVAPVLIYLSGHHLTFRRINPVSLLDFGEGSGAGGLVILGLPGLVGGAALLDNVLPLGEPGTMFSAGALPLMNLSSGLAVAAGLLLIIFEFLEQTLMVSGK